MFVRSGLRYDYLLLAGADEQKFLEELCEHHVSGQLKMAPEHASPTVLRYMRKGDVGEYRKFMAFYEAVNRRLGKRQYLVPYFMTSHPGSGLPEAVELAEFATKLDFCLEKMLQKHPREMLSPLQSSSRSEERRVGKECRSRWSPYH